MKSERVIKFILEGRDVCTTEKCMILNSNSMLSKSISTVIILKLRFARNIQSLPVAEVQKTHKTCKDAYVPMIDVMDVRDRAIVGTHLGQKSKSKNFIECIDRGIKYREADTKGLTIRTDNGPQFNSNVTKACISSFIKR